MYQIIAPPSCKYLNINTLINYLKSQALPSGGSSSARLFSQSELCFDFSAVFSADSVAGSFSCGFACSEYGVPAAGAFFFLVVIGSIFFFAGFNEGTGMYLKFPMNRLILVEEYKGFVEKKVFDAPSKKKEPEIRPF